MISAGGLIRAADGRWMGGFTARMGSGSSLEAEIWAVWFGIGLLETLRIERACIETDSLEAIRLIQGQQRDHYLKNLCDAITKKMKTLEFYKFIHIYREQDTAADFLSRLAQAGSERIFCNFLAEPPDDVMRFVREGQNGTLFCRLINE